MANVNTVGQFAENNRKKKHKEINEFFNKIILSRKRNAFDAFVAQLNNVALKSALSIDSNTISQPADPFFPTDESIRNSFDSLNALYNIFNNADEALYKKFQTYFKIAKIIADFIEDNNDKINSVAYLHAYKMMVYFGSETKEQNYFKPLELFLKSHNGFANPSPIHDALINSLPKCDVNSLLELTNWRNMIMKNGFTAVRLFALAPELEKIIGKAPDDYAQAVQAAATMNFKRENEYPELAKLCRHYALSEATFNRCLTIEKGRKKSDNLPDISIDGKNHGHPGYHLLKLPLDDPRAYILGHITNCCQSIGGASDACVVDGLTLKNNGFYVLLKSKNKSAHTIPPLKNGRIDYQHFKIVGQGYAWLSQHGNLTFDSWENLNTSSDNNHDQDVFVVDVAENDRAMQSDDSDDDVIKSLLTALSIEATNNHPDIIRVTIGAGGKTPKQFKIARELKDPERMLEGRLYADSVRQYLIHENIERKIEADKKAKIHLAAISKMVAEKFSLNQSQLSHFVDENMIANEPSSFRLAAALETYITRIAASLDRDRAIFSEILTFTPDPSEADLFPIIKRNMKNKRAQERKIDPASIFKQPEMIKHFNNNKLELWRALIMLSEESLLTKSNAGMILSYPANATKIAQTMQLFNQVGILNLENMQYIIDRDINSSVSDLLVTLNNLKNHKLLTQENLDALKAASNMRSGHTPFSYYNDINTCLSYLNNNGILTQKFTQMILKSYDSSDVIAAINCLHALKLDDDPEILDIIVTINYNHKELTVLMKLLSDPGISTKANVKKCLNILKNSGHIESASILHSLIHIVESMKYNNILNNENLNFLFSIDNEKVTQCYPHLLEKNHLLTTEDFQNTLLSFSSIAEPSSKKASP